jgi:hypothetical protein
MLFSTLAGQQQTADHSAIPDFPTARASRPAYIGNSQRHEKAVKEKPALR